MRVIDKILEARKELSDKQKKLDKNDNGKIDSEDLKIVRTKRDDVYTSDYKLDKKGHKTKAHKISFKAGEEEVKEEHMSPEQMKKKEDIVKGMKKSYKGFVQRYGKDRAKSVMYATATKNAMKEESEMNEALHPEADKVLKHIKPEHHAKYKPDLAKGVYKGDFADRTAVLKAAKAAGHLNEDAVDESTVPEHMKGKQKPYVSSDGKGNHEVLGNTGQVKATFTQKEHGKDAKANAIAHLKKNYDAYMKEEIDESLWPGTPEYKKKFDTDRVTGAGARHDIKKTATGVIATRRFADNDTAEKPKDAPKRGRGRPKKDKFAEAVEFLIGLDEETFDSLMEEGFDSFMEQYEQLDEISKSTLGSYVKKASRDAVVTRKIGADFENMADKSRKPSSKAAATELADKWKAKSWKRSNNIEKAVDRLTK